MHDNCNFYNTSKLLQVIKSNSKGNAVFTKSSIIFLLITSKGNSLVLDFFLSIKLFAELSSNI